MFKMIKFLIVLLVYDFIKANNVEEGALTNSTESGTRIKHLPACKDELCELLNGDENKTFSKDENNITGIDPTTSSSTTSSKSLINSNVVENFDDIVHKSSTTSPSTTTTTAATTPKATTKKIGKITVEKSNEIAAVETTATTLLTSPSMTTTEEIAPTTTTIAIVETITAVKTSSITSPSKTTTSEKTPATTTSTIVDTTAEKSIEITTVETTETTSLTSPSTTSTAETTSTTTTISIVETIADVETTAAASLTSPTTTTEETTSTTTTIVETTVENSKETAAVETTATTSLTSLSTTTAETTPTTTTASIVNTTTAKSKEITGMETTATTSLSSPSTITTAETTPTPPTTKIVKTTVEKSNEIAAVETTVTTSLTSPSMTTTAETAPTSTTIAIVETITAVETTATASLTSPSKSKEITTVETTITSSVTSPSTTTTTETTPTTTATTIVKKTVAKSKETAAVETTSTTSLTSPSTTTTSETTPKTTTIIVETIAGVEIAATESLTSPSTPTSTAAAETTSNVETLSAKSTEIAAGKITRTIIGTRASLRVGRNLADDNPFRITFNCSSSPKLCNIPSRCPLGTYSFNQKKCNQLCDRYCPGKLCAKDGNCFYDKCFSIPNPDYQNCYIEHYSGYINTKIIKEITVTEELTRISVEYKLKENFGTSNKDAIYLQYWIQTKNQITEHLVITKNFKEEKIPITYDSNYIICVYPNGTNIFKDPTCKDFHVTYRCLRKIKPNIDKFLSVTWKPINNSYLFQYRVLLMPQENECGKFPENHTLPVYKNFLNLKDKKLIGKWKIDVQGIKKIHDDDFCNTKQQQFEDIDFGRDSLQVEEFSAIQSDYSITIKWKTPENWKENCQLKYFELKWKNSASFKEKKENFICFNDTCNKVLNDIQSKGIYQIQVTPIFEGLITGITSKASVNYIIPCPQNVRNVKHEDEGNNYQISWIDDVNKNVDHYNVTVIQLEKCANLRVSSSSEVHNTKTKTEISKPSTEYHGISYQIQPVIFGSSPTCPVARSYTIPPAKELKLDVEELRAVPLEDSIQISWTIPSSWENVCEIKAFKIDSSTYEYFYIAITESFNRSEYCNKTSCAYTWKGTLKPETKYYIRVTTIFSNTVTGRRNPKKISMTTLEQYPEIPEDFLQITLSSENLVINVGRFLRSTKCSLTVDPSITEDSSEKSLFVCTDLSFPLNKLPKGIRYNITVTMCNTRGCRSLSRDKWTRPEEPQLEGASIMILSTSLEQISMKLPQLKMNVQGNIFIIVAKNHKINKDDAVKLVKFQLQKLESSVPAKRSDIESTFRAKRSDIESTFRAKRSEEINFPPVIVANLPMNTDEYTLKAKDVFLPDETKSDIFVSAVYSLKAGEYRSFGAIAFTDPIKFEENSNGLLIGILCFFFLLVIVAAGLVVYLKRMSGKSLKEIFRFKIESPENDDLDLQDLNVSNNHPKLFPMRPQIQMSNAEAKPASLPILSNAQPKLSPMRPRIIKDNMGAAANSPILPKLPTNEVEENMELPESYSSNLAIKGPNIHNMCQYDDDSVPECDYSNIQPNRSYVDELEFYLIQASHSPSLEKEFRDIPIQIHGKSTSEGSRTENRLKNRYQNNLPYDDTRVILHTIDGDPFSDYINANIAHINVGSDGAYATYIPTQGPLRRSDGISDFWRMVWQENVTAIVMLTNLIEGMRAKCDQYWPNEGYPKEHNEGIRVKTIGIENRNSFILRNIIVSKGKEKRQVTQYHYTEWPDHGVPIEASPLAQMINLLRAHHPYGPTVVHCSAGIGRTGALLLVLMCLEEIQLYKPIDIKECLLTLRNYRAKLVQNFFQYQFSHYLLWVMLFESSTTYSSDEFPLKWQNELQIIEEDDSVNSQSLSKQFQKLKTFRNDLTFHVAMEKNIRRKYNRMKNILPADSKRVSLVKYEGTTEIQYINAVRVDGFNKKDAYIVTEHPIPATIGRVWYMILERQIPFWILLNETDENDQDNYIKIVPTEEESHLYEEASVILLSKNSHDYFEESWVRITGTQNNETIGFDCRIIQFKGWLPAHIAPQTGPDYLLSMLEYIHLEGPYNSPLLFTCADGYTACGATLALDITRQRLQAFQEINIFSACIPLVYSRPEFIISLEQYRIVHDFIASYLLLQEQEIY